MYVQLALFLLLPIAACSGWYLAKRHYSKPISNLKTLPSSYIDGLNFLLNEQTDKAVDVFVKMLEVDSDTVETHFALGSLFRRRGEVERSIRIHQNLIARPTLSSGQRTQALLELGYDYMSAGVLDRAEALFLELVGLGQFKRQSLQQLREIYQQQHDWEQAVSVAQKYEKLTNRTMAPEISHYYCELAGKAKQQGCLDGMELFIKKALGVNPNSVRARIAQAELFVLLGSHKSAIGAYKKVADLHPIYITEVLGPLSECYEQQGLSSDFAEYIKSYLHRKPQLMIVDSVLSAQLRRSQGDDETLSMIISHLHDSPSIHGVKAIIDIYCASKDSQHADIWQLLQGLMAKIVYKNPAYQCVQCGFGAKTLYWYCPSCKHWDTVKPLHSIMGSEFDDEQQRPLVVL